MKTYIVDSFTREAFKGNPAGVCFVKNELTDEQMLSVAREFGLSETAFVTATAQAGVYNIRYFSPIKEIPLCGHATLASAKVLFEKNNALQFICFITIENIRLNITRVGDDIQMEFPTYQTINFEVNTKVLAALGLAKAVNTVYNEENKIILIGIDGTELLAGLKPDFRALIKFYNGILVTAAAIDGYDYHYRYFWPWAGTDEDPVTGGVQTFLAPYWSNKLSKSKMSSFQSSARTGFIDVEIKEDKVLLKSCAVIILEGKLRAFNKNRG